MSDMTHGQTVARDVLMAIALLQGRDGCLHLNDSAQTGDEREEVFSRIADAVDRHAETALRTLEGIMLDMIRRGVLTPPERMMVDVDFQPVVIHQLQTVGYDEEQAAEIVGHLERARTAPAE